NTTVRKKFGSASVGTDTRRRRAVEVMPTSEACSQRDHTEASPLFVDRLVLVLVVGRHGPDKLEPTVRSWGDPEGGGRQVGRRRWLSPWDGRGRSWSTRPIPRSWLSSCRPCWGSVWWRPP